MPAVCSIRHISKKTTINIWAPRITKLKNIELVFVLCFITEYCTIYCMT